MVQLNLYHIYQIHGIHGVGLDYNDKYIDTTEIILKNLNDDDIPTNEYFNYSMISLYMSIEEPESTLPDNYQQYNPIANEINCSTTYNFIKPDRIGIIDIYYTFNPFNNMGAISGAELYGEYIDSITIDEARKNDDEYMSIIIYNTITNNTFSDMGIYGSIIFKSNDLKIHENIFLAHDSRIDNTLCSYTGIKPSLIYNTCLNTCTDQAPIIYLLVLIEIPLLYILWILKRKMI